MTPSSTTNQTVPAPPLFSPSADESPLAFDAFVCYFELGHHRTLKKTAEILGISENSVEDWSSRHAWRQRLREYKAKLITARLTASAISPGSTGQTQSALDLALPSMVNELGNRLLHTSQNLFQHQLIINPEKIEMAQVLRMMHLGEKLLSAAHHTSVNSHSPQNPAANPPTHTA